MDNSGYGVCYRIKQDVRFVHGTALLTGHQLNTFTTLTCIFHPMRYMQEEEMVSKFDT